MFEHPATSLWAHAGSPSGSSGYRMAHYHAGYMFMFPALCGTCIPGCQRACRNRPASAPLLCTLVPPHLVLACAALHSLHPIGTEHLGATLHHLAMGHQRYATRVAMVVYWMHTHKQWLHTAWQGLEHVYFASFHKVSRGLWGAYEAKLWEYCYHHYDRVGRDKFALFSQAASHSVQD